VLAEYGETVLPTPLVIRLIEAIARATTLSTLAGGHGASRVNVKTTIRKQLSEGQHATMRVEGRARRRYKSSPGARHVTASLSENPNWRSLRGDSPT